MANTQQKSSSQDFISIKDLFYLCLARWYWFVVSLVVCLGFACYKLMTTEPSYTRTAEVLIKMEYQRSSDFGLLNELEGFNARGSFINEIGLFQSRDLMLDVVRRLGLDVQYHVKGRLRTTTLYGSSNPVDVAMLDLTESEGASLKLTITAGGDFELGEFRKDRVDYSDVVAGHVGDTVTSPIGRVAVLPSAFYTSDYENEIYVNKSPAVSVGNAFAGRLTVEATDDYSDIIRLTFVDVSIKRADDVLNTLMDIYNENWIKDKNQVSISTNEFITERLAVIEQELGSVDSDISTYKSENLLPDVQTAAVLSMSQVTEANEAIKKLNDQVYMAEYIRGIITSEDNKFNMLPGSSSLSTNITSQITAYNEQLIDRNSLVQQSSTSNPIVRDMDGALDAMREALVRSIDNELVALKAQIQSQKASRGQATSRVASNPNQAKYLLSVERQQKVKEALYLFLLQKREENELSQAFTANSTRIVNSTGGSSIPTSPVRRNVLMVAFAVGLLIPVALIFLLESLNTVVRGRRDLEGMTAPYLGEVPLAYKRKSRLIAPRGKQDTPRYIAVKENSRDIINEAFRVVRTNLEFMTGRGDKAHVIMITSANVSSGKTFITYNLAAALAVKGKRALAVDLDLRKASLSGYIGNPKKGLSDYLAGRADDLAGIVHTTAEGVKFDVLPVGSIPPNPSELLFSERMTEAVEKLRGNYDYIFLDCPPVEMVADASIVETFSDLAIFVVRAGLLEREMLPQIDNFYKEKKFKNTAVLLNGTEAASGRYGYKYGYKYGYGSHYASKDDDGEPTKK